MSKATELTKEREKAMKGNWPKRTKERIAEAKAAKKKNKAIYRTGVTKAKERAKAKRRRAA